MRAVALWVDKVHDRENNEQCIYDLAFKPDGSQLIVAAGTRVLVYDTADGALIQPLKGHKDAVYCVAYAKDGKRFASGGADKQVIIWTAKLEGILKYSHHDSIQCMTYNPMTHQLVSCSCSDFGLWSSEQKSVSKHRTGGRVTSCSWHPDGNYLALGLASGAVSIRARAGEEVVKLERPGGAAVWGVCWNPKKVEGPGDVLAVADWGRTLSFYNASGQVVGRERSLPHDPTCVSYFPQGDYLVLGGSGGEALVYADDGTNLGTLAQHPDTWLWCCRVHPDARHLALGCQDGTIAYYELGFSTVHSLYRERYAFRDNMTDVVVQHLVTEEKVRIKCRDLVKKLAIYKQRLAVQLPDCIVIYQVSPDPNDMQYKVKEKVHQKMDCSLLVVCMRHLVLCQERQLQCLSLQGTRERQWLLPSAIRYIKVLGGPSGREGLLVGTKDGQVLQLLVDNPFPMSLLRASCAVRCLDVSPDRRRLALVDDRGTLLVYDIASKELLFQEPNANSVAWNAHNADILCFTGGGYLSLKAGRFAVLRQKLQGFVVGFAGARVFCLHYSSVSAIEVPLTPCLYQYLESNMFKEAIAVARMGASPEDWQAVARAAMGQLDFDVARTALVHLRDRPALKLLSDIQESKARGEPNDALLARVHAHEGRFSEAARLFKRAGRAQAAVDMYADLGMFDLAREQVGPDSADAQVLLRRKAEWARSSRDPRAAANLFLLAGDALSAVDVLGKAGSVDALVELSQRIDRRDREALTRCAELLLQHGQPTLAADLYQRTGDNKALLKLYIDSACWEEALAMVEGQTEFQREVQSNYARWLAENDRFAEAQKEMKPWTSSSNWHEMQSTSIGFEKRATVIGCLADSSSNWLQMKEEPFTAFLPEALFHMSRYLLHELSTASGSYETVPGVSVVGVLYALCKQSSNLGAFGLARRCHERLAKMAVPARFRESLALSALTVRAKPFSDAQDLLPVCYRCSATNPLLSTGHQCVRCGQSFVHSFATLEVLPLVEYTLASGISDDEAVAIIQGTQKPEKNHARKTESLVPSFQTLNIEHEEDSENVPWGLEDGSTLETPTLDREALAKLGPRDIILCQRPPPLRHQFFRNVLPDVSVVACSACAKVFHSDDYEMQTLQYGYCPFCQTPVEGLSL
ncbi:intraflagellar transport protein 122 homolog isoform X2 [Ornithodoros turicata]|uniref:intraflagellar transport protein 122 homolog isoform X2 n=1 Tax=Ornithodoros turicata TaxID=34597 RepID=UPI0031388859